jgi:hypothetical protein
MDKRPGRDINHGFSIGRVCCNRDPTDAIPVSHAMRKIAIGLLISLANGLPVPAQAQEATKKFEIRDERAWLDGHRIDLWGIRSGNALMSTAVTERFVRNLDNMAAHGINAIAVYIMGSNTGWPEEWGARNGFEPDGRLKPAFARRLEWLIREADQRGMVVGVGVFTPRNVANLEDEEAYKRGLQQTAQFLRERRLRNVFVDIMHEYNHRRVIPELFREPGGAEKKAMLHDWFKEVNPEVPVGVCATIDRGTDPFYPGADMNIIQKTMAIPPVGYTINIESHKRDNYDSDGIFTAQGLAENYAWFETYKQAPNASIFLHAAFITGVTGRDGTAPHAEMGGDGSADDPGVAWYYEWVRDNIGRWEYPRHVPVDERTGGSR